DDGRARPIGGDARTRPGDSYDGPGEQRQRDDKHHRAEQGRRQPGRQEWQGQEPVERKPDDHRERPSKRRPNDDLRGIYRAIHGGTLNPRSLSISPCRLLRFRPMVRLWSGATEIKVRITKPLIRQTPTLERTSRTAAKCQKRTYARPLR